MTDSSAIDHHMMGIALMMAQRGLGRTAPNPSVGAVLVDPGTGEILARGTTADGGRPHAERIVIDTAGVKTRGATLYVTLEPCSHHGLTSPCADAIVEAGIARVVCGIEDPDPRVAGRGLNRLRQAGIDVTRGVRASEAQAVTRGHIARVSQRRPFVQLKLALAADGSVPLAANGRAVFVTSPQARALGHLLRAQADAILVGRGTVAADDPDLTCRLPGLTHRSPRRVVLARDGLDLTAKQLARSAHRVPVAVFSGPAVSRERITAMQGLGATVCLTPVVGAALWLPAVLETLAADGVTRLLVEGGPTVWRAFAQAALVDEVVMFQAGGHDGLRDPLALAARHLGPLPLVVRNERQIGPDTVWILTVDPMRSPGGQVPWSALLPSKRPPS